jgi:hypothetical protein
LRSNNSSNKRLNAPPGNKLLSEPTKSNSNKESAEETKVDIDPETEVQIQELEAKIFDLEKLAENSADKE